ncbi:hypothetical protein [Nocardioides jiangxiensis]|uniref:Uncharacterized protein n=1 Tax=Nocardioides jiangxiensis TaxID=3064524 RepID=A0ABT9B3G3_9ACTN|nr:hypothetical protein [Nocardioides sp. WY-20]MDO7869376.1 hypothetical protein [Nocardioides sp. WY-20]
MTGLGMLVGGFLVVIADLRFDGFDVISDPVGWMFVLVGLAGLTRLHPGFTVAALSSVVGLVLSVGSVTAPPGALLGTLESVAMTGVVFGTCTAILALSAAERDRRAAQVIRWIDLALTAVGLVAFTAVDGGQVQVHSDLAPVVVVLAVTAFAVGIWFLVLAWRVRREPAYAPGRR